jgi:C4-dicarboxylate-specific signal transduction histidine kinase
MLGAALSLLAIDRGSQLLAALAIVAMTAAMVLFVLSIWRPRRKVDWDRIETEQRLWESGPLGRSWLRVRRRLYDLWKI